MGSYIRTCLRFLARPLYSGIGAVFCLHRVVPEAQRSRLLPNRHLEITPDDLDLLLTHIRKLRYEILPLNQVSEAIKKPPHRKFIAFTFDDGYLDNLTEGLPVFRSHNAPFAVNITTGMINRTALPWWNLLEHLFAQRSQLTYSDGACEHTLSLGSLEKEHRAFDQIFLQIRSGNPTQSDTLVRNLFIGTGLDPVALASGYMMDWQQVRSLASDPLVTIGAHTVRHPVLSQLSADQLQSELLGSKATLEAELQRPIQHLAFPFGDAYAVGPREFAAARDCGFSTAATTRAANIFPQHRNHLQSLPRIGITSGPPIIAEFDEIDSGWRAARQNGFRRVIF